MTGETLKIVIPMAGLGTRLRPHTWSRPKQLVSVAGKAVLGHVLDMLETLPDPEMIELIFIIGYLGDQMAPYMERYYPEKKVHYVVQENPKGQSHAIYMAREFLSGPMLMVFADTLIEADLGILGQEEAQAVAWVKPVPDPRRFGVAEVGPDGYARRLVEKPDNMDNNLAVVGFYYFEDSQTVLAAIEEQMRRDVQLKGEYFLADAINIMLEEGLRMRAERVDVWLDAGTPEALLETNRYLLEHGRENSAQVAERAGVTVIPPVFVDPTAEIHHSVLGPHVAVGPGCRLEGSVIRNSILEEGVQVSGAVVEASLLGNRVRVTGRPSIINAGDDSVVEA